MNQRDILVLAELKAAKKGVTCYSFPIGVHFKDAILKLREAGHRIDMVMEQDAKMNRQIGRYFYKGFERTNQKPKVKKKNNKNAARDIAFKLAMNKKFDGETRILLTQIFNLLR